MLEAPFSCTNTYNTTYILMCIIYHNHIKSNAYTHLKTQKGPLFIVSMNRMEVGYRL